MEIIELPKITAEEIKELEVYETQALSVMEEAKMVAKTIHDAATHEAAAQWVAAKLGWCDRIEKGWLGVQKKRVFQMHKDWSDKINQLIHPVQGKDGKSGAVGIVREAQLTWRRAEDKRIADENAKAFAEAKKKDEEDRLAAAEKLIAQNNPTMADAVLSQAGNFVAPVIKEEKSEAVSYRTVWRIEVDKSKKAEFVAMVAARPNLLPFIIIHEDAILAQAKTMDGNLFLEDGKTRWPGVRVFQDKVPVYARGKY